MMKTAILAVILGLAVAQDVHRGRPFQNPNQAYHQQQRQYQAQQQQQQPLPQQTQQQPQQQQQAQPSQQTSQSNLDNSRFGEFGSGQISERKTTTTPIPILQWNKQQEHDGTYRASYETGNNIIAEESGYLKTLGEGDDQVESLVQQGSYSYMSPDGQIITIHYTADETGFHAVGDHIPTPPPVSKEIQKGLDLIYAGIRQQQVLQQQQQDKQQVHQHINHQAQPVNNNAQITFNNNNNNHLNHNQHPNPLITDNENDDERQSLSLYLRLKQR